MKLKLEFDFTLAFVYDVVEFEGEKNYVTLSISITNANNLKAPLDSCTHFLHYV